MQDLPDDQDIEEEAMTKEPGWHVSRKRIKRNEVSGSQKLK